MNGKLDPLQFAYQPEEGVEDPKLLILDTVYKNSEKPGAYARFYSQTFILL